MAYFEQTKITDSAGNVINPAKEQELYTSEPSPTVPAPVIRSVPGSIDDNLILLRRMLKLLESQAAVDPQQRQRITLDAISAAVALPAVTTVGTVTTVTTVSTVTSVTNIAAMAGWNQQMFADPARTAYNTGIRSQLTFG
jgi:hypothetical protein